MVKKIFILVLCIVAYLSIMGLIFGFNVVINNQNYIIINNGAIFEYKNKLWNYVNNFDTINGKKYNTYIDNEKIGYAKLQFYNSSIYVYKDNKPINYDEKILAYSGKRTVEPVIYESEELNDNDYRVICNYLNIPYTNEMFSEKVTLDFDKDGIYETLYKATVVGENNQYSIMFIQDDEIIEIEKYYGKATNREVRYVYLYDIIDINKDGYLEIVTNSSLHDNLEPCYRIYQYKKGIKLISGEC